ncbi:MAG: hypothetical protein M0Q91_05525 [Methanoregula sp.]|jgi:type IV secretory pathway VirB3-like protein|nr:hypothetical protein [Methanoregula sp.]
MSNDLGNVIAGTIFLCIFTITVYPLMKYYGGVPPASIFINALGITYGDVVICALIIGIVFIWSACQVFFFILDVTAGIIYFIYTNEQIRNFSEVIGRRANQTIGKKIRSIIRDIRREMRDKASL